MKKISENRLFIISGRKTHWNICNGEALMLTNNIQTKNWIKFQKGTHDNFFFKNLVIKYPLTRVTLLECKGMKKQGNILITI